MADTQDDSQQQPEPGCPSSRCPAGAAPDSDVAAGAAPDLMSPPGRLRTLMSPPGRLRVPTSRCPSSASGCAIGWPTSTGQSPDSINENAPLIELGMASRDAVAMASDIEDYTGVTVTATMAFRHPTIESLATVIVEGEPEIDDVAGDEDWSRKVDEDVANIAIVGIATRFPGDMNTAEGTWQALLDGRERHQRSARGALGGIPLRAADRRTRRQGTHPWRLPLRHQGLRRRVLRAVEDGSRQHRPAAADGARIDLGGTRRRPYSGVEPARSEGRRVHRLVEQRLSVPGRLGPDGRPSVRDHRHHQLDHRQPGVLLL